MQCLWNSIEIPITMRNSIEQAWKFQWNTYKLNFEITLENSHDYFFLFQPKGTLMSQTIFWNMKVEKVPRPTMALHWNSSCSVKHSRTTVLVRNSPFSLECEVAAVKKEQVLSFQATAVGEVSPTFMRDNAKILRVVPYLCTSWYYD